MFILRTGERQVVFNNQPVYFMILNEFRFSDEEENEESAEDEGVEDEEEAGEEEEV